MTHDNISIAPEYLKAIEENADFTRIEQYYTEDVVQIEFPNRLVAKGARRNLSQLREAAVRGRNVVASQKYEVLSAIGDGNLVALEVKWSAALKVAVGSLEAGDEMNAHFAVFLEFRDGKIAEQRNYDCFEPL